MQPIDDQYRATIVRKLRAEADRIESGGMPVYYADCSGDIDHDIAVDDARTLCLDDEGQTWGVVVAIEESVVVGEDADGYDVFGLHDLAALESPEPARPVVDPATGLLPCPFCGGEPRQQVGQGWADITCDGCNGSVVATSKAGARAAWNRRTP
jgi:hypothetical protein